MIKLTSLLSALVKPQVYFYSGCLREVCTLIFLNYIPYVKNDDIQPVLLLIVSEELIPTAH